MWPKLNKLNFQQMMTRSITIYHLEIEYYEDDDVSKCGECDSYEQYDKDDDSCQLFDPQECIIKYIKTYCSPDNPMVAYGQFGQENIVLSLKEFLEKFNNGVWKYYSKLCSDCEKYIASCKYCIIL